MSRLTKQLQVECRDHGLPLMVGTAPSSSSCTTSTAARLRLLAEAGAVTVASWGFNEIFHNPWCGALFRCGCTWSWAGGWTKCNVHNPAPNSPRCPWCLSARDTPATTWSTSSAFVVVLMVLGWMLAVACLRRPWTWGRPNPDTSCPGPGPGGESQNSECGEPKGDQARDPSGYHSISGRGLSAEDFVEYRHDSADASADTERWSRRRRHLLRVAVCWLASPATFVVHGIVVGMLFTVSSGYPYFLMFTFNNTQPASAPIPV